MGRLALVLVVPVGLLVVLVRQVSAVEVLVVLRVVLVLGHLDPAAVAALLVAATCVLISHRWLPH